MERTHFLSLDYCSASPVSSHACEHTPQNSKRREEKDLIMSVFFAEKMKEERSNKLQDVIRNVIPPHGHADTATLSLYKELIIKRVDPLDSKYAPACFFENANYTTCQKLTGVNQQHELCLRTQCHSWDQALDS